MPPGRSHFARTSWGYPQIIQVMDDHDFGSHELVLKHIETYILTWASPILGTPQLWQNLRMSAGVWPWSLAEGSWFSPWRRADARRRSSGGGGDEDDGSWWIMVDTWGRKTNCMFKQTCLVVWVSNGAQNTSKHQRAIFWWALHRFFCNNLEENVIVRFAASNTGDRIREEKNSGCLSPTQIILRIWSGFPLFFDQTAQLMVAVRPKLVQFGSWWRWGFAAQNHRWTGHFQ